MIAGFILAAIPAPIALRWYRAVFFLDIRRYLWLTRQEARWSFWFAIWHTRPTPRVESASKFGNPSDQGTVPKVSGWDNGRHRPFIASV